MASPTPAGGIVTRGTTATTTPVVNLPASIAAGETIFVAIRVNAAGAIGWPGGAGVWNELWDVATDASDDQFACAWKKADGSEDGTTITLSSASAKFSAVAWVAQGADDPTVNAPVAATVATGTSTSPNPPSLTPPGGVSKDYLFTVVGSWEGEQTVTPTYPTNYSLDQVAADSGTAGITSTNSRLAVAHRQLTTGSAEDPGTFTISASDDWMVGTILVHPAPPTTTLEGTGRSGSTLGHALSMILSYLVGPGRQTPPRGTGLLTQRLALSGVGRQAVAIGFGALTFAGTTTALEGTGRQPPAVGTGQLTQKVALAGTGRQSPALGTGVLTPRLALVGVGRPSPAAGTGLLTAHLALAGTGRSTPALGLGTLQDAGTTLALEGIGRQPPARGLATGMVLSYLTAPGRQPSALGRGALTEPGVTALAGVGRQPAARGWAELDLIYDQAPSRTTPAIGTGQLTQRLALQGTGRASTALGRGALTEPGITALAGTGRQPAALGTGLLTSHLLLAGVGRQSPALGTGLLTQRLPLVGTGRSTPSLGLGQMQYAGTTLALQGTGRQTPARGLGVLTARLDLASIGRITAPRGTGLLLTRLALEGIGRHTPVRGLGAALATGIFYGVRLRWVALALPRMTGATVTVADMPDPGVALAALADPALDGDP